MEKLKKYRWALISTGLLTLLPLFLGLLKGSGMDGFPFYLGFRKEPVNVISRPIVLFIIPAILLVVHLLGMVMVLLDRRDSTEAEIRLRLHLWLTPVFSIFVSSGIFANDGGALKIRFFLLLAFGIGLLITATHMPKHVKNMDDEKWEKAKENLIRLFCLLGTLSIFLSYF